MAQVSKAREKWLFAGFCFARLALAPFEAIRTDDENRDGWPDTRHLLVNSHLHKSFSVLRKIIYTSRLVTRVLAFKPLLQILRPDKYRRAGAVPRAAMLLDTQPNSLGFQIFDVESQVNERRPTKLNADKHYSHCLQRFEILFESHRIPLPSKSESPDKRFGNLVFRPEGIFPTAFAAQELAAAGIIVLQVDDCGNFDSPEEAACNVASYQAAIQKLLSDGFIDPERVGIVGFSRTCYHVLEALTTSALNFKAASVTDGTNFGYLQYLTRVDFANNGFADDADSIMGARPFGKGLETWLKRAPTFNMDKVTTPLQVVAIGRASLLGMWEQYAALRYLNKPVDLINLGEGTHILTNPGQRLVSQGGTVDWMRFCLQDYEDPDPAKAAQYARWRELRKLRQQNEKNSPHPNPN